MLHERTFRILWLPHLQMDELRTRLRSASQTPLAIVAELPTAPQWMLDYSRGRGLLPGQYDAPAMAVPLQMQREYEAARAAQQGSSGLWEWLHPQGVGTTARGFNDIYPPVGR